LSGTYVVIGAGPAGVAAAKALVAGGHRVTVVDTGLALEPEREAARMRMVATAPALWSREDVELTSFTAAEDRPGGYKRLFGFDVASATTACSSSRQART